MGLMKRFLEEKVTEFAKIHGKTEQEIYESDEWYALAVKYANQALQINGGDYGATNSF
jgi:hypothetical protein